MYLILNGDFPTLCGSISTRTALSAMLPLITPYVILQTHNNRLFETQVHKFFCLYSRPRVVAAYSGMPLNGFARDSVMKGSLDWVQISVSGLRVFLISVSSVPALMAMISGAASGSWAMGEPHSEQKIRWTSLPEEPLPAHDLVGPLSCSLALGTTATRASKTKVSQN